MSEITNQKTRPKELLRQMGSNLYRAAFEKGMSLSAYLEIYEDPSEGYGDNLDAFGRLLRVADIRVKTVPELGVFASEYDAFQQNDQTRALVPEWIARTWRKTQTPHRALYTSSDSIPGSWERPYADAQTARWDDRIAPAIPLSRLVAITTPIDTDSYRTYYLESNASQSRYVRVGEAGEVPKAQLTSAEHTVDLYKFGRGLEATYEQLRRQRIDKLAMHIARMAVQSELDKVAKAIDVLVNGDGNAGTAAASYDLTTDLDTGATAGTLTLKGWLAFKLKFANPYTIDTAIVQEDVALQMLLLNTGNANVPLVNIQTPSGLGAFTQINPGLRDNVALGWTADAPALKIVGIDTRFALERVIEIGSKINEIERFTTRQTEVLTMTEVEGYAIIDKNAAKILNVNA